MPRWGRSTGTSSCSSAATGSPVWDADGNEYLDATAGLWFANVGHGRDEIADAVAAQLRTLAAHHVFGDHANEPALELADRVAELAPVEDAAVFFGTGGGEAVDTAAKIVRRYWALVRASPSERSSSRAASPTTGRTPTARRSRESPRCATATGRSSRTSPRSRTTIPPPSSGRSTSSAPRAAAFVGEPMIGAGGAIPPPDGYWPEVERICRERGVLLIADEVISGFGRLGRWFGCERYGFTPDLMTCAKGISSGYVPLGAVVVSGRVREPFWREDAAPFLHGGTYAGAPGRLRRGAREPRHPRARAARRARRRARARARRARSSRCASSPASPTSAPRASRAASSSTPTCSRRIRPPGAAIVARARRRGVLTRLLRGVALQISPPFVVTEDELGAIAAAIEAALREVVPSLQANV